MSYKRLPGTSRNYIDTSTGEVLSRRQVDQRRGKLFESGFKDYRARKEALQVQNSYVNKAGEPGTVFNPAGVADINKAISYMQKNISAKDTALYSVRIKTTDGKWLSSKTGTGSAIGGAIGDLMSKYEIDMSDVDDIELVILG